MSTPDHPPYYIIFWSKTQWFLGSPILGNHYWNSMKSIYVYIASSVPIVKTHQAPIIHPNVYIHNIHTYIYIYITHDRWTTLMSFQQFWGGWECWELDSLRTRGATQHSKCCAGNDGNADSSRTLHFYGVETKHDWLVVWNHGILLLSIQLGMSSSQMTNSIIFQRGRLKPPDDHFPVPLYFPQYMG